MKWLHRRWNDWKELKKPTTRKWETNGRGGGGGGRWMLVKSNFSRLETGAIECFLLLRPHKKRLQCKCEEEERLRSSSDINPVCTRRRSSPQEKLDIQRDFQSKRQTLLLLWTEFFMFLIFFLTWPPSGLRPYLNVLNYKQRNSWFSIWTANICPAAA